MHPHDKHDFIDMALAFAGTLLIVGGVIGLYFILTALGLE